MNKSLTKTLPISVTIILAGSLTTIAQHLPIAEKVIIKEGKFDKDPPVICYSHANEVFHAVAPPEAYLDFESGRVKAEGNAVFDVTYTGFSGNDEAKDAFQYAVDIWSSLIRSPIPIKVSATFTPLEDNVLGRAIPSSFWRNFDNTPRFNTAFPVALAEKITLGEINSTSEFDIECTFNSTFDWYYNFDNPDSVSGTGLFDFATVVLHELGHGLGFLAIVNVDEEGVGSIGFNSGAIMSYTTFLESDGKSLVDSVENNSKAMGDALTGGSGSLLFNGTLVNKPKIWAPNEFNQGSSISHVDGFSYPPGTQNSLMGPSVSPNVYIHDPAISLDIMNDYGWEFTWIEHEPVQDTENPDQSFDIVAKVTSDIGFDTTSLKMLYSQDTFNTSSVVLDMLPTGNPDEYSATIPNAGTDVAYNYYIEVFDTKSRRFSDPGQAPSVFSYRFHAGTDTIAPTIEHTPTDFLLENETDLEISASIEDIFMGVDTAYVEYSINDVDQTPLPMAFDTTTLQIYKTTFDFSFGLTGGDIIKYRIVSRDKSMAQNETMNPEEGFHQISVESIPDAVLVYFNDFNLPSASEDFLGEQFTYFTPNGFIDGAMNSLHPYEEAGVDNEINYIAQLKVPIIIDPVNPVIEFEEIVLVEFGEPGSIFGEVQFWDYVIVEGSEDQGATWIPLVDGYDCRANASWNNRYRSSIVDNISTSPGDPSLYRKRSITITDVPEFEPSEEILIRFRLFSDEAAAGWGWAVDNLQIQGEPLAVSEYLESEYDFKVYPNPSETGGFKIHANLRKSASKATFRVVDMMGRIVARSELSVGSSVITHDIHIEDQPAGVYFLNAIIDDGTRVTRKIVKAR